MNADMQASGSGGEGGGSRGSEEGSRAGAGVRGAALATHVYVSGYGPEITHFVLDRARGELVRKGAVSGGTAPSYLAIANDGRALYAVNEASAEDSRVVAFAIDPQRFELAEIDRAPSGGDGAPHLAVHPSGEFVAVAHYGSGHTSVLPVREDRGLGAPIAVERGPDDGCRKAHQAVFDRSGRHLFVPCLENDFVLCFAFDGGVLAYAEPHAVKVRGGPRHLAFSPDERHAYVLSELSSQITWFAYDPVKGALSSPQVIASYEATPGASAHIAVHPSGRFLYASNRAENSLGLFALDGQGRPRALAFEREGIATPRDFAIDPLGEFLILANQSDREDVRVYRIDVASGRLTHVQSVTVGGQPTCVGFLVPSR